jgi:hypothetical protein
MRAAGRAGVARPKRSVRPGLSRSALDRSFAPLDQLYNLGCYFVATVERFGMG